MTIETGVSVFIKKTCYTGNKVCFLCFLFFYYRIWNFYRFYCLVAKNYSVRRTSAYPLIDSRYDRVAVFARPRCLRVAQNNCICFERDYYKNELCVFEVTDKKKKNAEPRTVWPTPSLARARQKVRPYKSNPITSDRPASNWNVKPSHRTARAADDLLLVYAVRTKRTARTIRVRDSFINLPSFCRKSNTPRRMLIGLDSFVSWSSAAPTNAIKTFIWNVYMRVYQDTYLSALTP